MYRNFGNLFWMIGGIFLTLTHAVPLWAGEASETAVPDQTAAPDLTERAEYLGIPLQERYPDGEFAYARNVWTMQAYAGKVYLGAGAYDNSPPAANAGPVPIFAFDPEKGVFEHEWTVPDEQIGVYRVFSDGQLYAPGIDPREGWDLGNFYRKQKNGEWEKVRTFPNGIHNLDMAEFQGKIFCGCYGIGISDDWGKTMVLREAGGYRIHSFFQFPTALLASSELYFQKSKYTDGPAALLYRYVPEKNDFEAAPQDVSELLPDTPIGFTPTEDVPLTVYLIGTTPFKDRVLYRTRRYLSKAAAQYRMKPFGAYSAEVKDGKIHAVRLALPENIFVMDFTTWRTEDGTEKCAVLFCEGIAPLKQTPAETEAPKDQPRRIVRNHVWESSDGVNFVPLFSFEAETFARSFAHLNGWFYFGLGTSIPRDPATGKWTGGGLHEKSGMILRIPACVSP